MTTMGESAGQKAARAERKRLGRVTEYGLEKGVTPATRRAAAGSDGVEGAEAVRDMYALDNMRDDEKLGSVRIGRQAEREGGFPFDADGEPTGGDERRAPFGDGD